LKSGKNYGLDTRIDRFLQACISVVEMGFPHLSQFDLGDPQLGLLLAHAYQANNESLLLWDMSLKLWAELVEKNAMDAFWTSPRSFRLFMDKILPPDGEVIALKNPITLGGGIKLYYIVKIYNKIY